MIDIKTWTKVLFIFILIGLFFFVFQTEWFQLLKNGNLDVIVKENIDSILIVTLIIMVIQNTFTIIPLILIISINYTLFGFFNGFLWSWFTSIIGAALTFYGSRYLFQSWIIKIINVEWLNKIETNGFIFVFQGRIIPFIPTSLINMVGGISTINFKSFLSGTILGNFIYFFFLTLVPAGFLNPKWHDFFIAIILAISIVLYLIHRYKKKNKTNNSEFPINKRLKI